MLTMVKAGEGDLDVMSTLLGELFANELDFRGAVDRKKQERGLKLILEHPDSGELLLLKREGRVAGMANLLYNYSTFEGGLTVVLEDFILEKAERGRGSGRWFMEQLIRFAEEKEALRISLLADKNNERALHFYEAAGYKLSNMHCLRLNL